jgi:hypothetical protein
MMNYRAAAKQSLERALQEMESTDTNRLRYAALELRMALEALVYERANNYATDASWKKLSKWQPKKLLRLLLEIDPSADKDAIISIGEPGQEGQPASIMHWLGRERVLKLEEIDTYYDRLGSYLHTPTKAQVGAGAPESSEKILAKCKELAAILQDVFTSQIFNSDFKISCEIKCVRCGAKVYGRLPPSREESIATCLECEAQYRVKSLSDEQAEWQPITQPLQCSNKECMEEARIFQQDIKPGICWKCEKCGQQSRIVLGILPVLGDE